MSDRDDTGATEVLETKFELLATQFRLLQLENQEYKQYYKDLADENDFLRDELRHVEETVVEQKQLIQPVIETQVEAMTDSLVKNTEQINRLLIENIAYSKDLDVLHSDNEHMKQQNEIFHKALETKDRKLRQLQRQSTVDNSERQSQMFELTNENELLRCELDIILKASSHDLEQTRYEQLDDEMETESLQLEDQDIALKIVNILSNSKSHKRRMSESQRGMVSSPVEPRLFDTYSMTVPLISIASDISSRNRAARFTPSLGAIPADQSSYKSYMSATKSPSVTKADALAAIAELELLQQKVLKLEAENCGLKNILSSSSPAPKQMELTDAISGSDGFQFVDNYSEQHEDDDDEYDEFDEIADLEALFLRCDSEVIDAGKLAMGKSPWPSDESRLQGAFKRVLCYI